jgi:hypothetical protein
MSTDKKTNSKNLVLLSRYLIYHTRMYVETLLEWNQRIMPVGWETINNALLEAQFMSARAIIDFLTKKDSGQKKNSDHANDVFAEDYIDGWGDRLDPGQRKALVEHKKKIEKRLLHLTDDGDPNLMSQQSWEIKKLSEDLLPILWLFYETVPGDLIAERKKETARQLKARVEGSVLKLSGWFST